MNYLTKNMETFRLCDMISSEYKWEQIFNTYKLFS